MNSPLTFTLFPNLGGLQATEYTTTTGGMADWLEQLPEYPNKDACPLISLNRYGKQKTVKGSLRHDANILQATGAIGDYDLGTMTPKAAADALRLMGIEAVIVTTPSHGLKGNRWRVIAPFANAQNLEARHALTGKINTILGGVLATESFPASQAFYVGRVAGVQYEVHRIDGVPIDILPGVEQLEITGPAQAQPRTGSTNPLALIPKRADDPERVRVALSLIANDGLDWNHWNRVGMAVYIATYGSAEGLEMWREWSDRCPMVGNTVDTVDARWLHYHSSPPTNIGMGALVHMAGGAQAIRAAMPTPDVPAVLGLELPPGGKGNTTLEAAVMVERHIAVAFDEFKQRVVLLAAPPWREQDETPRNWIDTDTIEAQVWMQGQLMKPSKDAVIDAVAMVAKRNGNHPVRNYLDKLKWDGKPRLDTWLSRYLGAEATEYTSLVGAKFLISAIARIYQPGCQADYMMVLEGIQGERKSSVIRELLPTPEWFTDELPDVTNKDAAIQLHGVWIVEVSEMDAMGRAEAGATKKFVTRRVDRYRPVHGRATVDIPRQTVFMGSVNPEEGTGYLKDQTGNRRFWPVKCGRCDVKGVAADRDQLWAEARERYLAGEEWFVERELEKRLIHPEQEHRRERHPWEDDIADWLEAGNITAVTTKFIASVVLKLPIEKRTPASGRIIANALRGLGWSVGTKKQRFGTQGPGVVFYRDPDDPRMSGGAVDHVDNNG